MHIKLENLKKILPKTVFDALVDAVKESEPTPEKTFSKLTDGSEIGGKIAENEPIVMKAADGSEVACPDGDYAFEDGTKITVLNSVITKIEAKAAPEQTPGMTPELVEQAIQTALSAQKTEFEAQIKGITDAHKVESEATLKTFASLAEALEVVAGLGAKAPEPKDDPRQKFAAQQLEGQKRLMEIVNKINPKK